MKTITVKDGNGRGKVRDRTSGLLVHLTYDLIVNTCIDIVTVPL